jgi:hypothetical protein
MGAAIPQAIMLATSLPAILPFSPNEIKTSITTGTSRVLDEIIPIDEDDEGGTQGRNKATIEIIIRIISPEGSNSPAPATTVISEDSFSD